MIAVWPYLDASLVTQPDPTSESGQLPNELGREYGPEQVPAAQQIETDIHRTEYDDASSECHEAETVGETSQDVEDHVLRHQRNLKAVLTSRKVLQDITSVRNFPTVVHHWL